MFKRFISMLLTLSIMLCVITSNHNLFKGMSVSAYDRYSYPVHGCAFRIQHVGSNKYLDVTDGSTSNGARLQIWQGYQGNQNQIFQFVQVGNYWRIVPWHSQKSIEVRNSSYDDYAHISQWDYAGIACQQWKVIKNSDGTVSFQNRNSGKFLDVCGNCGTNGTKIIQYTRNNSNAQKFILYCCTQNDILNASWQRDFSKSPICWSKYDYKKENFFNETIHFKNRPGYSNSYYSSWYPANPYFNRENNKILIRVDYIDEKTVFEMTRNKSKYSSFMRSIKDLLVNEGSEEAASYLLGKIGINVPIIGIPIGVLQIIFESDSKQDWNKFANTAEYGKGIIVYTYSIIRYDYIVNKTYITEQITHSYYVWDGQFSSIKTDYGYSGNLAYTFK